jgi:hypothetical protein
MTMVNLNLDAHATDAERAEADRLLKIDFQAHGDAIQALTVSCYVATGEDGRPEEVHEIRVSDGSCRCGYNKARRWDVTLTSPTGRETHAFTWGVRRSTAYARVARMIDGPEWEGYSFTVADTPTLVDVSAR